MPEIRLVHRDEVLFLIKKLCYQVGVSLIRVGSSALDTFWDYLDHLGFLGPIDYLGNKLSEHPALKVILVFLSSACCLPVVGFLLFAIVTFFFFAIAYPLVLVGGLFIAVPVFVFLVVCLSLAGTVASVLYFSFVGIINFLEAANRPAITTVPVQDPIAHQRED